MTRCSHSVGIAYHSLSVATITNKSCISHEYSNNRPHACRESVCNVNQMTIGQKPTAQGYEWHVTGGKVCLHGGSTDTFEQNPLVPHDFSKRLVYHQHPLRINEWRLQLKEHPDPDFVAYILRGITEGFRIGFNYQDHTCESAKRNMKSALDNPQVVREYLALESKLGRIEGPLNLGVPGVIINRFGVIPKPHQPGKWRLVVDLSHPKGSSVNDGIESVLCSLSYASVDDAVSIILQKGQGTLLAKLDLESAYRIIPVHPQDRHLLGMQFDGKLYVDTALPFGLRSAPKIFSALADGLLWIMTQHGIHAALHYLDDYIFMGNPETSESADALKLALQLCEQLGLQLTNE